MGSLRTAYDPRWWMLVSAHEIRNIFCLRTAQVAWEPIKTDKTSFLLAHKSLDCVTLIFGFQQFYTCWVSEEKIFRQKFGNFVGESCLLKFTRRTAHENVTFWIIAVRPSGGMIWRSYNYNYKVTYAVSSLSVNVFYFWKIFLLALEKFFTKCQWA